MPHNLDEKDIKVLSQLQKNARASAHEISRRTHLSPNAVRARIRKLENKGYIKQYVAVLNRKMLDRRLMSITGISLASNSSENLKSFLEFINRVPEVSLCHHVSGTYDFLLQIFAIDMKDYHNLLVNKLGAFGEINGTFSFFVLNEVGTGHFVDLTHLLRRNNLN
ncbi:Lrp/AsnC family transcriptional regulator [Pedobacter nyackensis]|uniref:Winged helix-turn-helix DNA-binding n=1 Tax=Pedobacter nyackensis TaxID=475255 RepID=A0A1W2F3L4_9SPHI|nr:Lrp/AsnC family transcriptional regulator [Pedobacter nyackensis]SMD16519.1 Winged helix-turn-helix DNA-binding [Pedobacter nyackensis]